MAKSAVVVTDSGGIQEETTVLGTPCITARENTERPITVQMGTNMIAGADPKNILNVFYQIVRGKTTSWSIPSLWDGKSGQRIVKIVKDTFG